MSDAKESSGCVPQLIQEIASTGFGGGRIAECSDGSLTWLRGEGRHWGGMGGYWQKREVCARRGAGHDGVGLAKAPSLPNARRSGGRCWPTVFPALPLKNHGRRLGPLAREPDDVHVIIPRTH
jgi:hypothetical protein